MSEGSPHQICELEKKIAVLETQKVDSDRALAVAREVDSARAKADAAHYRANISLLLNAISIGLLLLTLLKK